jgi:NADPH:quinone reductase
MAVVLPSGSHGGYSERLALPWRSVVRVPDGASFVEAATLPMNGLTARLSLDLLSLPPGSTLLVTGAAGCYGGYVVQLAKADGLVVIADASEADDALVHGFGADVVIRRGNDLAAHVRALYPHGVDACADGAVMNKHILHAVRDNGKVTSVRTWDMPPTRGITHYATRIPDYIEERDKLDRLRQQVNEGIVTLRVARTFPYVEAADAHRMLERGGTRGRLVLEF